MLMGLSGGIRQSIIKEIKRTEKMSGQWKIKKNKGFLRQFYCVSRLANFGIIQPSNHNREPEKSVISRCLIRRLLIGQFPDDIQIRRGRRAGVPDFPQAKMLQYLLDDGLLFDKADDFHLSLAFGA